MSDLRWGLIGYGDLADKRVAAALREANDSTLVGLWGRDTQKTRDFAGRHSIANPHGSLEDLLNSDIDAVYVCSPPDSHAQYTLAALEAGKHVLVEKPMAATAQECEEMIEAARANECILGVAYYRRAFPKMRKVKELVDGGMIGIPTWVNIAAHSWFSPAPDDPKHWRVEKARSGGGGAIADIGVHRLDLLDYWLGPARLVFKSSRRLVHTDTHYEVEDGASAVLELANGAPVHVYLSWNSKTWMDRFEIVGSEGKILIEPFDSASLVVVQGRTREELEIEPPANAHLPCVEDFVKAVKNGSAPLCDGETGLRTSRLLQEIVS